MWFEENWTSKVNGVRERERKMLCWLLFFIHFISFIHLLFEIKLFSIQFGFVYGFVWLSRCNRLYCFAYRREYSPFTHTVHSIIHFWMFYERCWNLIQTKPWIWKRISVYTHIFKRNGGRQSTCLVDACKKTFSSFYHEHTRKWNKKTQPTIQRFSFFLSSSFSTIKIIKKTESLSAISVSFLRAHILFGQSFASLISYMHWNVAAHSSQNVQYKAISKPAFTFIIVCIPNGKTHLIIGQWKINIERTKETERKRFKCSFPKRCAFITFQGSIYFSSSFSSHSATS